LNQFLGDDVAMLSPDHIELLIRAFNSAWEYYFQPDRNGGVLECLARPALAEFLVGKLREGIDDEPSLAVAGLQFLFSLEDTQDEPIDAETWLQENDPEGVAFEYEVSE
jgi:hypothetical protein